MNNRIAVFKQGDFQTKSTQLEAKTVTQPVQPKKIDLWLKSTTWQLTHQNKGNLFRRYAWVNFPFDSPFPYLTSHVSLMAAVHTPTSKRCVVC